MSGFAWKLLSLPHKLCSWFNESYLIPCIFGSCYFVQLWLCVILKWWLEISFCSASSEKLQSPSLCRAILWNVQDYSSIASVMGVEDVSLWKKKKKNSGNKNEKIITKLKMFANLRLVERLHSEGKKWPTNIYNSQQSMITVFVKSCFYEWQGIFANKVTLGIFMWIKRRTLIFLCLHSSK